MIVKIELEEAELNTIVGCVIKTDPTGFYSGELVAKIRQQYAQQKPNSQVAKEERDPLINKIEKEISTQPNQPTGFLGKDQK